MALVEYSTGSVSPLCTEKSPSGSKESCGGQGGKFGQDHIDKWLKRVGCRDIFRITSCVETYWTAGSSLDPNLLADPYMHELMLIIVEVSPSMSVKKTDLRDAIILSHKNSPCLFHLGTAHKVATTIAERIRKVLAKYRFLRKDETRFKQTLARAGNGIQKERLLAVLAKMELDECIDEKNNERPVRLDPIADLENFLSEASPRSQGLDDTRSPTETPSRGMSSAAVVPARRASAKCVVIDLLGEETDPFPTPDSVKLAIAEQLCELEQFAGPAADDHSPPVSAAVAELEAELMLMNPQDIPKPGCSRSLPKAMKTNNNKKAMAATSKTNESPEQEFHY